MAASFGGVHGYNLRRQGDRKAVPADTLFLFLSVLREYLSKKERFARELGTHLSIAFSGVGIATIIGIPVGIIAYRKAGVEKSAFFLVNTAQTVPSLALFGLLIAPLSFLSNKFPVLREMGIRGIGTAPAIIALALYALLPIIRNTFTSLKVVDPAIIEAGRGMGLGRFRLLLRIEFPLAAPVLLNGLRLAAVQAVGNTAVAALIGAGGLGFFIFQGLGQAAADLVLLGAIPVVLLAVLVDRGMQLLIRLLTPEGLRLLKTAGEGTL
jgi:osmoprotectant transport system permease protein